MAAVEFGVLLPTREAVMSGHPETASMLAMAERAEAEGFDAIWIGDSVTARPRHEPLTLLAAVAARTRRVRLGTAVLLPALRNPVVLAHVGGTLDRIAEGRVILGVGIAADTAAIRKEFDAVGVPFERRVGRFLEIVEICRGLWTRDRGRARPWPARPAMPGRSSAASSGSSAGSTPAWATSTCGSLAAISSLRWTKRRRGSCPGSSAAEPAVCRAGGLARRGGPPAGAKNGLCSENPCSNRSRAQAAGSRVTR